MEVTQRMSLKRYVISASRSMPVNLTSSSAIVRILPQKFKPLLQNWKQVDLSKGPPNSV
jgi:hypothetical protein